MDDDSLKAKTAALRPELKSGSRDCPLSELFLLSTSLFYTPRAWGDQGSADSSELK